MELDISSNFIANIFSEFRIENDISDSDDEFDIYLENQIPVLPAALLYINFNSNIDNKFKYSLSDKLHTNNEANTLIEFYNNRQFYKLIDRIERLRKETYFFSSIEDLTIAIEIFNKYVKIKNWLRRVLYNRQLKKCTNIVNTTDLCFMDISANISIYNYYDLTNSSIYLFTRTDLVRIMKMSLLNTQYEYPNSYTPRNPYTNLEFSIKDIVEIILYLEHEYRIIGKSIPNYIIYYKNSYYDVELYYRNYMSNNVYRSYKNYIDELEIEQWWNEYSQFILDHRLSQLYCKDCLVKNIGIFLIRRLVSPVLSIHYLNNMGNYTMGNAIDIYKYLCSKMNIKFENNHYRSHIQPRRLVRARRLNISQIDS